MMKNTKQTLILLLAVALTYGCGGGESVKDDVASGVEAYVNELEKKYIPAASTEMLSGRTWTSHRKGDFIEYFEEVSFTDSTRIYRYKSVRPDTIINVCDTTRYYLSLIGNPGKFDESKVGKHTKGEYLIMECTYEGRKTYCSDKILFVSPMRLETVAEHRPYTIIGGTEKQTLVREE